MRLAPPTPADTRRRPVARIVAAGLIASTATLAGACSSDGTSATSGTSASAGARSGVRVVQPADAWRVIQAGDERLVVIDVRTPAEYSQGHVRGAVNIDFYASDFAARIGALDRRRRYVIYCRSGNRSGQARSLMERLGFTDVLDVDGGIVAWTAAQLPLVG